MLRRSVITGFLPLFLLGLVQFQAQAQNLKAFYLDTVLPYGFAFMPAVYDGHDSVYLLGGKYSAWHIPRDILRYSVRNNSVDVVGEMIDLDNNSGDGVWVPAAEDSKGRVLYFGGIAINGINQRSEVLQYNLGTPAGDMVQVGALSRTCSSSTSVWDGSDTVYVIGGFYRSCPCAMDSITRYSLLNNTAEQMPDRMPGGGRYSSSAIRDNNTGLIYIFGGRMVENTYTDEILQLDPSTGVSIRLNVSLPTPTAYTCAVWTGTAAYIFGGNKSPSLPHAVRFTPSTGQVEVLEIEGFPLRMEGMGCTYVQNLNRIYVFGGYEFEFNNYDRGERIFIINLD